MASKELSILLLAKDMASKTIGKVSKQIGGLGKMGRTASAGLSTLAGNLAKVGVAAAVGIGAAVKSGVTLLADLENATTNVAGAISQMGLTGKVAADQVVKWANEIEDSIGAAFDERDIARAAGTLIRFGKTTPANLRPAMQVMTDLATKTGSVDSAATLLAKALADPEKAAGKLARSGVILTKVEQEQIKAFMKAGQAGKAQQLILDSLAKTTKNAAVNSVGPYQRSLNELGDASEHARMALAEGFLPVIMKIATLLRTKLADPAVIAQIRSFGVSLAGAFDKAVTFAERVPWDSIGQSLKIAGMGAKAVFDAFTGLPPWVQAAVLTGWGLNKLTGGALGSIVGQLASGLVKGVLGLNAGVVNAKAGVVNVVGGVPGVGGKGGVPVGPAAGVTAVGAAAVVAILGSAAVVSWLSSQKYAEQNTALANQGLTPEQIQAKKFAEMSPADRSRAEKSTAVLPGNRTKAGQDANLAAANARLAAGGGRGDRGTAARASDALASVGVWQRAVAAGLRPTASAVTATLEKNRRATISGDDRTAARIAATTAAVNAIKFAPKVNVTANFTANISVRTLQKAVAVNSRYQSGGRVL